jgi:hypothetical protein
MQSPPYMRRAATGQAAPAARNGAADRHRAERLCGAHLTRRAASTIFRALTGLAGAAPIPPDSLRQMKAFKDCKA